MPELKHGELATLHDGRDFVWDSGAACLEVRSPHALTRAAGYLKYVSAQDATGPIYLRGQTNLYESLRPALYRRYGGPRHHRGTPISQKMKTGVEGKLADYLKATKTTGFLRGTPDHAREALLQHYTVRTRWLDLVDNVWVALWFSVVRGEACGPEGQYLHFTDSDEKYGYILLISPGAGVPDAARPGVVVSEKAEVVDLRQAAPSLYVRPHAQHGLLFRRKSYPDVAATDLMDFKVGVIRVLANDARSWVGLGRLADVHSVFPPPHFDQGYLHLLEKAPAPHSSLGSIAHIGA
jgi:hypothetical protein